MQGISVQIETISAEATLEIRHRVLWPNKPKAHCLVPGDNSAVHFGIYVNSKHVGVASVFDITGSARLRKLAVDYDYQGRGLGAALTKHAIEAAKESGANLFWCDARESAINFYRQFGLKVDGEKFYKSELPYYKMSVSI